MIYWGGSVENKNNLPYLSHTLSQLVITHLNNTLCNGYSHKFLQPSFHFCEVGIRTPFFSGVLRLIWYLECHSETNTQL